VVDALVGPVHAGPSAALAAALREWPGTYYWSNETEGRHLVLTRRTYKSREAWSVHILLFAAVLVTTTLTGAMLGGGISMHPSSWHGATLFHALSSDLLFSLPLLAILR